MAASTKTKKCPACKAEMTQGKGRAWYCSHCDLAHDYDGSTCALCKNARGFWGTGPPIR